MITINDIIEKGRKEGQICAIYWAVSERNKLKGKDMQAIDNSIRSYISDESGLFNVSEDKKTKLLEAVDFIDSWEDTYRALKILVPLLS